MESKTAPAKEEETILLFHTGNGHGPLHTKEGLLRPNESLGVEAARVEGILRAYPHIKRASDIIPAAKGLGAEERAKLEKKIAALEKSLEERTPAAEAAAKFGDALKDFLDAEPKALKALQEKHKDLLAAPATAGAGA